MEKRKLLHELSIQTEQKVPISLQYYILKGWIPEENRIMYGIEIEMQGAGQKESSYYLDVTSIENRAMEILALLAKYTVTPVTLRDVLEDLL